MLRQLTETIASGDGSRPNGIVETITGTPTPHVPQLRPPQRQSVEGGQVIDHVYISVTDIDKSLAFYLKP